MMMRATSRRFISSARLAVWERDRFANQSLFEDRYAALLAEKDDLPSTAHGIVSSLADTMAIKDGRLTLGWKSQAGHRAHHAAAGGHTRFSRARYTEL